MVGRADVAPRAGRSSDRADATSAGSTERLRRQLQGDLDTIVLAALRKEPGRRYPSVEQLAGDIRRYLDGLPVQARADTFGYRAGKFVRRNRVLVAAGVLLVVTLLGGTAATVWQARDARAQAEVARAAQARAEHRFNDLRKLARAVLFDYHDAIKDLRGSTPVRERLVRDGLGYLDGLAREAQGGNTDLRLQLSAAYDLLGQISLEAGEIARAVEFHRAHMRQLESAPAAEEGRPALRRALSVAYGHLGDALVESSDLPGALQNQRRSLAIRQALAAEFPDNADYGQLVSSARYYEAAVRGRMGRWREALTRFHQNLAEDPNGAFSHVRVGDALDHLGRREESLDHFREAFSLHAQELRADSANLFKRLALAEDQSRICRVLANLGRAEAPAACAGTATFVAGTPVEPTHAFPRAFFEAIWSDLGEAYDTLAARRPPSPAAGREYRVTARDMYRRSLDTWADLTARGLVSPIDTGRLSAATRAVARAEDNVRLAR